MTKLRRLLVLVGLIVGSALIVAPAASAVDGTLGPCTVQLNDPHSSSHSSGRINTEFRALNCSAATTYTVAKKETITTGGSGQGDIGFQNVGTIHAIVNGSKGVSIYYNEDCVIGQTYTVKMQGRFTHGSDSLTLTAQATFVCKA